MNLPWDVTIRGACNGLIIQIGCKTIVCEDKNREALLDVFDYVKGKANLEKLRKFYNIDTPAYDNICQPSPHYQNPVPTPDCGCENPMSAGLQRVEND
jgi:hypothetical protein